MSDAFAKFQADFERFANQTAAEGEAVRTILQSLLVSMFGNHPNGTDLLNGLRSDALATLSRQSPDQASNSDRTRMREAAKLQAEEFFEDMRKIFPKMTPRSSSVN